MNKAERQALADWIRQVADLLYLRDWDFDVVYDTVETPRKVPDDQEWGMTFEQTRHRKHGTITVPPDARTRYNNDDEIKLGLVHELIHAHWAVAWDQVRTDLLEHLSQQAYDLFVSSFERNLEYGVDALAYAFAEYVPDIKWPETKKK